MPSRADRIVPALLYLATFALAALFALRTPPWQAPDEPAHYAYVATVATTGQPPILEARCYDEAYKNRLVSTNFAEPIAFARFCYEGHQPPLFYYLAAPVYLLSGGALLALRLFCALLGAGVVVAAWGMVRAAGGDRALALATAALVALVPQHLAMLGSLNNDALCFLLVALCAWQMIRLLAQPAPSRRDWALLGLLIALALLTKVLAWLVLPLAALTLWLRARAHGAAARQRSMILVFLLPALFLLPWFGRNAATYALSDPLALQRHDEIAIGQPRTEAALRERGLGGTLRNGLETVFHSFWGQFGWMKAPLQPREYQILLAFSGVGAVGLLGWLARRGWQSWGLSAGALLLCALWALTNVAMLVYYNLEFIQYQGRYLFSSLMPLALFLVIGLGAWLPPRLRPLPWTALLLFLLYLDALAVVERLPGMMGY